MNEYRRKYSPETYHLSDTQSVYVRLEGTTLRISHTKLRIPKRAMWNERTHKLKFYHQRIYSLEHCYLKLLPEGLTRRRWEVVIYNGKFFVWVWNQTAAWARIWFSRFQF